jgi:sulfite exporter TauE/SafE
LLGRLSYQAGRLATYSLLGIVLGLIGTTLTMAGVQRWVSIAAGFGILAGVLFFRRGIAGQPVFQGVNWLKSALGAMLRRRTLSSQFLFGGLNGLLPCGLVYAACTGALAMGSLAGGIGFMLAFGLGTVPMMLALSLPGGALQARLAPRFQRLIPACLVLMGFLLILRGLSLGIPYLSPDLAGNTPAACCHQPAAD